MTKPPERPLHARNLLPTAPSMAGMTVNVLEPDGSLSFAYSNGTDWVEGANIAADTVEVVIAGSSGYTIEI